MLANVDLVSVTVRGSLASRKASPVPTHAAGGI